jgi:hypothetical protein
MTLDQLFVEAGEHLDELIEARHASNDGVAVRQPRGPRTSVRFAAAAVALAGLVGLALVVGRHDASPSASSDSSAPTVVGPPHVGPVSVFDTGADLAIFIKPGSQAEQVALIQDESARVVSAVGTLTKVEYLPSDLAMAEARRVNGAGPTPSVILPESTPTLLRIWVTVKPGATLADLPATLTQLPNVLTVWTRDTGAVGQYPLCCSNDGGAVPQTTLAPLASDPIDSTLPAPGNDANRAQIEPLLTGLTQLGFANSEYTTDADGVTTVTAWAANQTLTITITITPGSPVTPENHLRPLIGVLEQTADTLRLAYASNAGWKLTLDVHRTGTTPLPKLVDLENLIVGIDP